MRTVNIKGESTVNGSRCTMERTSSWPCTITIPPSKACTTGTTSKPLGISLVEDDTWAGVLCKRTVSEKVIGSVTEGATSIRTVAGQVGEMPTEGAIISDTAVLQMTGSPLATAGALILGTVDMEMACGKTLKTTSLCSRNGFWAQAGIARCNSRRIRGHVTLVEGRLCVSGDVRRDVEQCSGGRLWRRDGIIQAWGWGGRVWCRDR